MSGLTARDFLVLLLLSAIWGSSFLFMRMAVPEFGPFFLIEMRVFSAFVVLFPVCLLRGQLKEIKRNYLPIFVIGLGNMAIPFTLLAYATLSITAGLASILNATVPFFTAIIGFLLFQRRLSLLGVIGLIIGFGGVAVLVADPDVAIFSGSNLLAVSAGLLASFFYGTSINFASHRLAGVSGLPITTGGLFASSLGLAPLAVWQQPEVIPAGWIWLAVITLGVVCTGVAYLLFYKLISRVGPQQAVTVTYLVPLFSIAWGWLFLAEQITPYTLAGCVLVLAGVSLTTGKLQAILKKKSA